MMIVVRTVIVWSMRDGYQTIENDAKLRAPHPIYRVCPSQSSTNSLSERGLKDRDVSLLLNVVEIRVERGRKMNQILKTNSRKIAMGKNKKTVETKRGSSKNSIILPLGPFNSTSIVTRNIIYESWR